MRGIGNYDFGVTEKRKTQKSHILEIKYPPYLKCE